MKVAVSCDWLVERNHLTSIVEAVLELYDEAEMYCLIHAPGQILGPVEQRKIHSTFMSRFKGGVNEAWKKAYVIPGAAKNLFIPCSVDLIINISSGLSHGIKKCEKTKMATYLVDLEVLEKKPKGILGKLSFPFIKDWVLKSLKKPDTIWPINKSLHHDLKDHFDNIGDVLPPFFKISDYPLFPAGQQKIFPRDFWVIHAGNLDVDQATHLIDLMKTNNQKFKFAGIDDHLESIKKDHMEHFYGNRCSGELAPLLAATKGIIDLDKTGWPEFAFKAMACGRPVICFEDALKGGHLEEGLGVNLIKNLDDIENHLNDWPHRGELTEVEDYDKKIRATVMKFHDVKFKAELKRRIEGLLS
ncbi:MAG: glycosyltransferase family 4 protein [Oligoflexia bacterium]|nr:glycosyltransferase family 4 protein [Oligoflexia bacterium]